MQPCKTGDQAYSDASPNGECALLIVNIGIDGLVITVSLYFILPCMGHMHIIRI